MAEIAENTAAAAEKKASSRKKAEPVEIVPTKFEKYYTVNLPSTDNDDAPVYVSVNNRDWLIPRDVDVQLPECAYMALQRSIAKNRKAKASSRKAQGAAKPLY